MSHDQGSKLTEAVENPYGLPEGWVAVSVSLIQRAKDMTMDICNSRTGHCPDEIYCPQIYATTARELNEALRNILSASVTPEGLGSRSACGGCSPQSTSNYASCDECRHNPDRCG